ncbi:MAG: hypothetical protein E7620_03615 [Ruminococcaceae bacterium]|nr:hypothetical protein [Oscillospiraceae bacterium]
MNKRSALYVIFLCLLSLTLLLSACGGGGDTGVGTTASQQNAETPAATTAGTPSQNNPSDRYVANLPAAAYNNEEFVFLTRNAECGDFETWDLLPTDLQRESMNDAILRRNSYIEETYNVTITQRPCGGSVNGGEMYTVIYNNYMAGSTGEDAFHVAYCGVEDAISLATSGIFYDLSEMPYINLESPWWDAVAMSSLTISNRYFFGVGDLSVQLYDTLPCLAFNKELAAAHTELDLYGMVESGEWTYDAFYTILKEVYVDTDDVDGPSVGDTFGAGGQNDNLYNFFYGSGCKIITVNENGDPELTYYNETNETVFSKLFEIMTDKEALFNCNDYANVPGWQNSPIEYVTRGFIEGRILFYSDGLLHLPELREADFEFGILPVPKFTAEQESYHHLIGRWGATVITIPTNCPDLKMATLLVEAMGAESKNTVAPEYFENKLTLQSVRDGESAVSLNIIIDTKGFDMGQCFRWNDLHLVMGDCLLQKQNSFYHNYQAKESGILIGITQTLASYQSLPHYIELEG